MADDAPQYRSQAIAPGIRGDVPVGTLHVLTGAQIELARNIRAIQVAYAHGFRLPPDESWPHDGHPDIGDTPYGTLFPAADVNQDAAPQPIPIPDEFDPSIPQADWSPGRIAYENTRARMQREQEANAGVPPPVQRPETDWGRVTAQRRYGNDNVAPLSLGPMPPAEPDVGLPDDAPVPNDPPPPSFPGPIGPPTGFEGSSS